MLIPLRTNRPSKRRPVITEVLIVANLAVYLTMLMSEYAGGPDRLAFIDRGSLARGDLDAFRLLAYQFLHDPGGLLHLGFNMLFLWVFGGAVESRLGRIGFLGFYLIGGAVSGVAHTMVSAAPVIGASGSICAVTGAFLALFPRSRIIVLFFFILIGVHAIPATWFIGFFVVIDLIRGLSGSGGGVAYGAHLAGYAYGFGLGFALLALRILPREEFDVFFLFRQWRRRAEFRRASRSGPGGLYDSASADTGRQLEQTARKRRSAPPAEDPQAVRRGEITRRLASGDLDGASADYVRLLAEFPQAALAEAPQADIANHLAASGRDAEAALAYERLLASYPRHSRAGEVRLMLAVLYGRRLDRTDDALRHLTAAAPLLPEASQRELAAQLRAELEAGDAA